MDQDWRNSFTVEWAHLAQQTIWKDLGESDDANVSYCEIGDVLYGDADGNGKIDNIDSVMVYNFFFGLNALTDDGLRAADVNRDG